MNNDQIIKKLSDSALDQAGKELVTAFISHIKSSDGENPRNVRLDEQFSEFLESDAMKTNLQNMGLRLAAKTVLSHITNLVNDAAGNVASSRPIADREERSFTSEEVAQLLQQERAKDGPRQQQQPAAPQPNFIEGAINAAVSSPFTMIRAAAAAARDIASDFKKKPENGVMLKEKPLANHGDKVLATDQKFAELENAAKVVSGLSRSAPEAARRSAMGDLKKSVNGFVAAATREADSELGRVQKTKDSSAVTKSLSKRAAQVNNVLKTVAASPGAKTHEDVKLEAEQLAVTTAEKMAELIKRIMNFIRSFFGKESEENIKATVPNPYSIPKPFPMPSPKAPR